MDTPYDIVTFVGHLRVEVDVGNTQFLGIHPCNQVLYTAIVAVAIAKHDHADSLSTTFEHERVGLAPFSLISLHRARLVEFELVSDKSYQIGHGHVLSTGFP